MHFAFFRVKSMEGIKPEPPAVAVAKDELIDVEGLDLAQTNGGSESLFEKGVRLC